MIRTFQPNPTVRGSARTPDGLPPMATAFDRFIAGNVDCLFMEEGREFSDFTVGFAALRRIEMRKIAAKHGLELDENLPGEEMKSRMEQWFLEGKLPIPDSPQMVDQAAMREQIKQELLAELRDGAVAAPNDNNDDGLDALSWDDLKRRAADLSVFDKTLNRDQLTQRIRDVG